MLDNMEILKMNVKDETNIETAFLTMYLFVNSNPKLTHLTPQNNNLKLTHPNSKVIPLIAHLIYTQAQRQRPTCLSSDNYCR